MQFFLWCDIKLEVTYYAQIISGYKVVILAKKIRKQRWQKKVE